MLNLENAPNPSSNLLKNRNGNNDGNTETKKRFIPALILLIYLVGFITKRIVAIITSNKTIFKKILYKSTRFDLRTWLDFDIVIIEDIIKYMQKKEMDMKNKNRKIALALGSGGAKGFAHIGVLKAFEEAGIKFDIITGCSMGAIVGSCYALGVSPADLEARAVTLTTNEILDVKLPNSYGFIKGNKAERTIRELLGAKNAEPKFSDCKTAFGCIAADIAAAEVVNLTEGDIIPAVRASFSIGGVFRPVEIDGKKLLDGGILSRVPVYLARKMGADIVVAVDCIGKTESVSLDGYKYFDTLARVFNIMDYHVSKPEINSADFLISLSQPMVSAVRVKNVKTSIDIGYETTKSQICEIKKLLNK